jgi:putative transposase
MAKATTTIRQSLQYQPHQAAWLAATQALFNQVAAFYFEVIQAHDGILGLSNKEALTSLEKLTHTTQKNPHPVMPLCEVAQDIPAMFRRAAIHAALGSARSFSAHLAKWKAKKQKAQAKGKKFTERPPVPPRTWNKSTTLYAGMWKERKPGSLLLKVWTGSCWSWLKVRLTGRELPEGGIVGSPSLVRRSGQWWLHTPIERTFSSPATIANQVTTNPQTKLCAVDLNLDGPQAVCTIQTVEGTILATKFISGGRRINGFRKKQLGRIARNRCQTGLIAEGEQDNQDLWQKIRHADENLSQVVSARIVQFAKEQGATILVFEHLGRLKPQKGTYSKRGNSKRAFWMKGRIFQYAKYKAWNEGMITSRISPRNTSRECARCHGPVIRYKAGEVAEGYTPGAPLVLCPQCEMRGHADRNASVVIGQRLIARYQDQMQEKPPTPLATERVSKETGVGVSQEPETEVVGHSSLSERHGNTNEHGTAQERGGTDGCSLSDMPPPLRPHRAAATLQSLRGPTTEACQKPLDF